METTLFHSSWAKWTSVGFKTQLSRTKPSVLVKNALSSNRNNGSKKKQQKPDSHSFIVKPNEATGPFPENVLLKKKKVQVDGRFLPDFADKEEEKLYEFLNLELQSKLKVDRMRHYEVVFLVHEKHDGEVDEVVENVKDFIREKKGRLWRLNDWGMRRLAYKIKKATNAHYFLMNFEVDAKWINDFKTKLDQDERVIRHLVIKRDEAITEDCPPPPEFHTLRADFYNYEEVDDLEYDDEDWAGEVEVEVEYDDGDIEKSVVVIDSGNNNDSRSNRNNGAANGHSQGAQKQLEAGRVGR